MYFSNHIIRILGNAAPKRKLGPVFFLFQNLHSYKINNKWVKFDKNLGAGSFSED